MTLTFERVGSHHCGFIERTVVGDCLSVARVTLRGRKDELTNSHRDNNLGLTLKLGKAIIFDNILEGDRVW